MHNTSKFIIISAYETQTIKKALEIYNHAATRRKWLKIKSKVQQKTVNQQIIRFTYANMIMNSTTTILPNIFNMKRFSNKPHSESTLKGFLGRSGSMTEY